jgi:mRNA-degrading endonuclease RelE of RelBE toxin-antitoxin system
LAYRVVVKASVQNDLSRCDRSAIKGFFENIEGKLAGNPEMGMKLSHEFAGLYTHDFHGFRIVYTVMGQSILLLRVLYAA